MLARVGPNNHVLDGVSDPPGEGAILGWGMDGPIVKYRELERKDGWLDRDGVWHVNSRRPKALCVRWEPGSEKGVILEGFPAH